MLPTIATAAVLNHVFGFNMTKTAILGAIFGGIIIGAASIVGTITWPVIAAAAIVGTLFAGVAISGAMVIDALINENAPAAVKGDNRELSPDAETGFVDPREVPGLKQAFNAGQDFGEEIDDFNQRQKSRGAEDNTGSIMIMLDGARVDEQTGKHRFGRTTRRGE
jgi:hypothetical protein